MDRHVEKRTVMKVLHVDDEQYFLVLTKRYLESENDDFTVDSVTSAEDGIALLKRGNYDVAIADYQMPGMDGLRFLQHLREEGNTIPFIMLTGRGREEVAIETLNRGANHYIQKGVDTDSMYGTVAHAIRDAVEKKRAVEALRKSESEYRTIFETTGTATVIIEEDTILSLVNTKFEELSGYSQEEVEGKKSWTEFIVEEDLERMNEYHRLRRIDPNAAPTSYEFRLIDKAGNIRAIFLSISMIPGTGKSIASLLDLTERKRAENLINTQRDLALALNAATGLNEGLRLCLESAIQASEMDCGGIYLVDETTGALDLMVYTGFSPDFIGVSSHYGPDSPSTRLVMANKPLYARHSELGVPLDDVRMREGLSVIAVIPVHHEDRVVGCLNIASHTLDEVSIFSRGALETIAAEIGSSIARLQAEEALRESEQLFQSLVDNMLDAVMILDWKGEILLANKATAELGGFKSERELLGLNALDFIHPSYKESVIKDLKLVKRDKGGFFNTYKLVTKDGEEKWIESIGTKITFRDKTADLVNSREVTEHKRAEEELKRYQVMVESAHDAIFFKDLNSRYIIANEKTLEAFGLSRDEVIGKIDYELMPEKKEAKKNVEDDQVVFKTGKLTEVIKHMTGADGKEHWFEAIKVPHIDTAGHIAGLIGVARDITERKQTEEALRESEEQYRLLFNSGNDAVFVHRVTTGGIPGKIIDVNDAACKILGYTRGELLQLSHLDISAPDELGTVPAIRKKLLGEKDHLFEIVAVAKDGRKIPFEISAHVFNLGGPPAVLSVARDITERKRAGKERERFLRELEAKNRELERFTYTVSHDLQSPLITIQGFTDMLQKDLGEKERKKVGNDLQHITKATTQMSRFLHDTLELSRIGRVANPPEDVPFGEIVEEVLRQTAGELTANNVRVSVAKEFPTVHVDRMRIVEVLVNLITNCIKYMGDPSSPEIDIGYRVEGAETVFFVKDNGIGIDPSRHEKVFELFYRVDNRSQGSGVGLAIVKRIIDAHGGHIWMESEEGRGCMACFTLPVVRG
jgi:PAS domain S-box-containing protein